MDFRQDYYRILGVAPTATLLEIRASYRKLIYLNHPDRNPDKPEAEETVKQINEAYEVLTNDFSRKEYDDYRRIADALEAAARKKEEGAGVKDSNKRTQTITRTFRQEHKVFIKGTIVIKYYGSRIEEEGAYSAAEDTKYTIEPTDVRVVIKTGDIHRTPQNIPAEYQRIFKETDLFRTPLAQPIHCTIIADDGSEECYDLELKDIKVANPQITHAQKEEGASFGTLEGELYAYVPQIEEATVEEENVECFGETGNVEFKEAGGRKFIRKESYNKDCSTYWGSWAEIPVPVIKPPGRTIKTTFYGDGERNAGCGTIFSTLFWLVPLGWLIFSLPTLIPILIGGAVVIGVLLLISWLVKMLSGNRGRGISRLAYLLIFAVLISAFFNHRPVAISPQPIPAYDSFKTTTAPAPIINDSGTKTNAPDRLITHFIRWKDYDDSSFAINLEVLESDVQQSARMHEGMQIHFEQEQDINLVYQNLLQNDTAKLRRMYAAFDTLRTIRHLDETHFAQGIVTCIQSVQYYLVLEGACNAANYTDDAFITSYLAACRTECCVGHSRYGVRAPAEMLGDLKGDCDSRALILYAILQHYHYDIALLTSFAYKHALLAVHFKEEWKPGGINLNIHNQPYYLWETTSKGFRPGDIPSEISNTANWEISLLNEGQL